MEIYVEPGEPASDYREGGRVMDEFLRTLISRKWRVGRLSFTFLDILLAVCITGTGVFLRLNVIEYTQTDVMKLAGFAAEFFLAVLCAVIVHHCTGSRNRAFLTYAVLAIYPTVIANGALWNGFAAEFFLAVLCAVIVHHCTGSRNRAFLTYAVLAIYPTVIANGALWNRGTVFYAILLFAGLYFVLRGWKALGVISFLAGGAAAAYRVWCWVDSFRPALPGLLTRGLPNIYEIIGKRMFADLFAWVSLLFLLGLLITAAYCFAKKRVKLTAMLAVQLFLFLALLIPYFAPYMPAWAGYTADIAALLYCMCRLKRFYFPMLQLIVSYSAYANVINGETKLPMVLFSVIQLAMIACLGADIYRETKSTEAKVK